jgi:hypothetical protein
MGKGGLKDLASIFLPSDYDDQSWDTDKDNEEIGWKLEARKEGYAVPIAVKPAGKILHQEPSIQKNK